MYTKVYAVLGGAFDDWFKYPESSKSLWNIQGKKIFHLASIYYGIVLQNTKERIHFCLSKKMQ